MISEVHPTITHASCPRDFNRTDSESPAIAVTVSGWIPRAPPATRLGGNSIDSQWARVQNFNGAKRIAERRPRIVTNKKVKFGIGIGIILAVVAWEAISGFQESKTYYVTVSELTSGKTARQRVRVGGIVAPDSIARRGGTVSFRLAQDAASIPVTYVGTDTLPDTFRSGAQAIVEGDYTAGGEFRAEKIQAKCASKYQATPAGKPEIRN